VTVRPIDLLDRCAGIRALVLGDPILDSFVVGQATRLCLESPVPVVVKESEEAAPGGAANVAAGLAGLGAEASLIGMVGDDVAGRRLRQLLTADGVDTSGLVIEEGRPTTHKLRVIAGGQYVVRIDEEDLRPAGPASLVDAVRQLRERFARADVVVVADYAGTLMAEPIREELARLRRGRPLPLVVDSKDLRRAAGLEPTVATPNVEEASAFLGVAVAGEPDIKLLAAGVRARLNATAAVVTLGARGVMVVADPSDPMHIPAPRVDVLNAVGAGDSFTCGLALGLGARAGLHDAVRLGIEVAAAAVAKPNTAVITAAELRDRVRRTKVVPIEAVARLVESDRAAGRRVVFTNGVFDLLHAGHADLLRRARALGDRLVVGVNGDASASRLKGDGRPVMGVAERCSLVAGLEWVDLVFTFDELTAETAVRTLRPDVYVKGDDHDPAKLPEAAAVRDVGGEIVLLPRSGGGVSTTAIIDRIMAFGSRTRTTEVAPDAAR
jgi:D-beta-D-heptose 7-phosphate kinase/D-beta-D-heptose 1-phosphate adenosyltransferase